jgi:hypothetical protein
MNAALGIVLRARRPEPDRATMLRAGIAVAVVLSAAEALAHLIDYGAFSLSVKAFDANTHASLFGAFSLLGLEAAGCAAASHFVLVERRRMWSFVLALVLTIIFGFRVVHPAHVVLLAGPFTALAFLLLWQWPYLDHDVRRVVRAGCLTLAASLVVHKFGLQVVSMLGYSEYGWGYQVKGAVKHGLELGGWILVAAGLVVEVIAQRSAAETAAATSITP